ncbi:MAG TPA: DUF2200 domain-containing protein [Qipengyuania sp.]|nr:DUF2200 domain-containing protein [Qipengyuania sp.]
MPRKAIGAISFAKVYPMYVQKVERKGRTKAELDEVIDWLTGYDRTGLAAQIAKNADFASFFAEAPQLNPARAQITGLICGHRVEEIADPLEQQARQLDKIVDELAKGKALEKIKRN